MVSMKRKIIVNTLVGLAFLAIVIWAILSLGVSIRRMFYSEKRRNK